MANPPFDIAHTLPGNTDAISPYPAIERAFRDIVKSWLLWEHGESGHHAFVITNTAGRDSITTWETGALVWNNDHNSWQIRSGGSWLHLGFPAGTKALFHAASAPTGWTVETGAAFDLATPRGTTGSVGTGGSPNFSTVFSATRTVSGTVAAHALTVSEIPSHRHTFTRAASSADTLNGQDAVRAFSLGTGASGSGQTDLVGGGAGHSHGWTGSADLDVKFFDVFVATRNAA